MLEENDRKVAWGMAQHCPVGIDVDNVNHDYPEYPSVFSLNCGHTWCYYTTLQAC